MNIGLATGTGNTVQRDSCLVCSISGDHWGHSGPAHCSLSSFPVFAHLLLCGSLSPRSPWPPWLFLLLPASTPLLLTPAGQSLLAQSLASSFPFPTSTVDSLLFLNSPSTLLSPRLWVFGPSCTKLDSRRPHSVQQLCVFCMLNTSSRLSQSLLSPLNSQLVCGVPDISIWRFKWHVEFNISNNNLIPQ